MILNIRGTSSLCVLNFGSKLGSVLLTTRKLAGSRESYKDFLCLYPMHLLTALAEKLMRMALEPQSRKLIHSSFSTSSTTVWRILLVLSSLRLSLIPLPFGRVITGFLSCPMTKAFERRVEKE